MHENCLDLILLLTQLARQPSQQQLKLVGAIPLNRLCETLSILKVCFELYSYGLLAVSA